MKKFLYSIILSFFVALSASFFGCSVPTFSIEYGSFNTVVEYNSNLTYLDKGLAIVKRQGKEKEVINITQDMIVSCDDTSSVGKKKIVVLYEEKTYIINFTVKYKVDFVVDNNVIDTQYVLDNEEIELPDNPYIDGCEFIGWSPDTTDQITDNTTYNANFTVSQSGMPLLLTYSATYGDTLKDISLPKNANGEWQFLNNLTTSVGNAGEQYFDVKFVPYDTSLVSVKTDKVKIKVNKKLVKFEDVTKSFSYDGSEKLPQYTLSDDVQIEYIPYYSGKAINKGNYEFELEVADSNYKGSYYGSFEIKPIDATISIEDINIKFTDIYPQTFNYSILDKNGEELSKELVDLMGFELEKPSYQHAGLYEIGAKINNDNFNVTINKGYLTVQKVEHDLQNSAPTFVGGANVVYGGVLSDVVFENNDVRGKWSWKEPNTKVLTPTTFKATAVFTPDEYRDYLVSEKEIEINVNKKPLTINVTQNSYTYDKLQHSVVYDVFGIEENDLNSVSILGNQTKTTAGTYDVCLSVDNNDTRYVGSTQTSLIINQASISNFEKIYYKSWSNTLLLQDISLDNGYQWLQPLTQLTELGSQSYPAKFVPDDTVNYKTEVDSLTVEVVKAQAEIFADNNYNFEYNPKGYQLQNVTTSHNETQLEYNYFVNGKKVESISTVGEYQVILTLPESKHYNKTSLTTLVTVQKAVNRDNILTYNATYDDMLSEYALPQNSLGTWSWQQPNTTVGNAGEQFNKAIYTPKDPQNYMGREVDVKFNIAKKSVAVPADKTVTYNGEEQQNTVAQSKYYTIVNQGAKGTNAGEYTTELQLDTQNCYWLSQTPNEAKAIVKLIINKNTQNNWLIQPTISKQTWDYIDANNMETEKAGEITQQAEYGNERVVVEYKDLNQENGTYTTTKPTNAGSYEARIYIPENNNYAATAIQKIYFEIKHIVVTLPTQTVTTYNGNAQKADIETSVYYSIEEYNGYINAGIYSIKVELKNPNYMWSDGSFEIIRQIPFIVNKVVNTDNIALEVNAEYKDKLSDFSIATSDFGTWAWQEQVNELSTVGDAGDKTFTAVFTPFDSVNYEARQESVLFKVAKKLVELPTVGSIKYQNSQQNSGIEETDLYTVVDDGGIEVDTYYAYLTLKDAKNYRWPGDFEKLTTAVVGYKIEKNINNVWIKTPTLTKSAWDYIDNNNKDTEVAGQIIAESKFGAVYTAYKLKNSNQDYTVGMPVNAGEYLLKVYVEEQDEYNGLLIENIEIKINYISVTLPTQTTTTYNGKAQKADIPVSVYYTIEEYNGYTNASTYSIKVELKNPNYMWSDGSFELVRQIPFVINKVANNDNILTYNATYDDMLSEYALPQNSLGTWSWQQPNTTVGNAGEQFNKAIYTPKDPQNYMGREVDVKFNIAKKPVAVPADKTVTYNGEEQQNTVAQSKYYTIVNQGAKGTNAGEYTTELQLDTQNCYWLSQTPNEAKAIVKLIINKNTQNKWLIQPTISKQTWDYIDANNMETEKAGEITQQAEYGNERVVVEYRDLNQENATYTTTKPTNAGSYEARIYIPENNNYAATAIEKVYFTINKILVDRPEDTKSTYNGESQKSGITQSGYYTILNDTGFKDADVYDIEVLLLNDNYTWKDGYVNKQRTVTFTIKQATNSWIINPGVATSYQFTFTDDYEPVAQEKFGVLQTTYYKVEGESLTQLQEHPHNVGSYKVTFTVEGNKNYTALSETLSFVITPAQLTFVAPQFNSSAIYYENTVDISTVWLNNGYSATYEGRSIDGIFDYVKPSLATSSVLSKTEVIDGLTYTRSYAQIAFNTTFKADNFIDSQASASINLFAVCRDSNNKYYGTIENALDNTSSGAVTVMPYPLDGVVIAKDTEVKSGVSLVLPYLNASSVEEVNSAGKATLNSKTHPGFSKLKLTNKVFVNSNITLTNNGTITIAGETSGGGATYTAISGNTAGNYAKIILGAQAKIQSYGTINSFGYIDELTEDNGSQVIANKGTIYMPFVIYDYRGGNYMMSAKNNGVTPFNQFDLRNIVPQLTIYDDASLIGHGNLFAKLVEEDNNYSPVYIVGNGSDGNSYVIQLKDNAYMVAKYRPINREPGDDKWQDGINDIKLYGGADSKALTLTVMSTKISTSEVDFPISFRQNITLVTGDYTMNQKFKLLPGSVFTVNEGVNLTINKINIYQSYTDNVGLSADKPNYPALDPADSTKPIAHAMFNVYGSLTVTTIGGNINVDSNSKIKVTTCGHTTYEVEKVTEKSFYIPLLSDKYKVTKQTFNYGLYLKYTVNGQNKSQQITSAGLYSFNQANSNFAV